VIPALVPPTLQAFNSFKESEAILMSDNRISAAVAMLDIRTGLAETLSTARSLVIEPPTYSAFIL
jgi:hypothetical protein